MISKMGYIIATTTAEKENEAKALAKKIVESKAGACVQINPIESFYIWEGKLEIAKEFKITIKTLAENYKKVEELIIKNSKYDLPEITSTKIDNGYSKYLDWLGENSK